MHIGDLHAETEIQKQNIKSWSHGSAVVSEEAWLFIWSSEKEKKS